MKVVFLVNRHSSSTVGGAELVNNALYNFLCQQGVECLYVSVEAPVNSVRMQLSQDALIILTTFHNVSPDFFDLILGNHLKLCIFRHDVPAICYDATSASAEAKKFFSDVFGCSRLNIFVSPLQLHMHEKVCPIPSSLVLPPPLSFENFQMMQRPRSNALYLGPISRVRGVTEAIEFCGNKLPGERLDFIGRVEDADLAEEISAAAFTIRPEVDRSRLPYLMNSYRHLVYFPRIVDAFCLKILEAELCGLDVLCNKERVGRFSYTESAEELAYISQFQSAKQIYQRLKETR
jgi:glycosyltransferase involved in cell wall biosynthesis